MPRQAVADAANLGRRQVLRCGGQQVLAHVASYARVEVLVLVRNADVRTRTSVRRPAVRSASRRSNRFEGELLDEDLRLVLAAHEVDVVDPQVSRDEIRTRVADARPSTRRSTGARPRRPSGDPRNSPSVCPTQRRTPPRSGPFATRGIKAIPVFVRSRFASSRGRAASALDRSRARSCQDPVTISVISVRRSGMVSRWRDVDHGVVDDQRRGVLAEVIREDVARPSDTRFSGKALLRVRLDEHDVLEHLAADWIEPAADARDNGAAACEVARAVRRIRSPAASALRVGSEAPGCAPARQEDLRAGGASRLRSRLARAWKRRRDLDDGHTDLETRFRPSGW